MNDSKKQHQIISVVYSLITLETSWLFLKNGFYLHGTLIPLLLTVYLLVLRIKHREKALYDLVNNALALNIDWFILMISSVQLVSALFFAEQINGVDRFLIRICVVCIFGITMIDVFFDVSRMKRFLVELNQKLEQKLMEINNFQIIAKALNSILDLEMLLNMILDMTTSLLKVEIVTLFLLDKEEQVLVPKIFRGMPEEVALKLKVPVGERIVGYVAKTGENLLIRDIDQDERFGQVRTGGRKYRNKSLVCVPLKIKNEVIGVLSINNKLDGKEFNESDRDMAIILASQAAIAIENAHLYENMQKSYISTIRALSAAIDAKDKYTSGHSSAVTSYTFVIAKKLGLGQDDIEKLEYAGLLHDIGKIGILEQVLNKPGRLTNEEFDMIKQHPVIGYEILKSIDFLKEVTLLVRYHHERYDGNGYPEKLKGDDIPLGARIIAVADTFDAMTSDRPYRKGLSVEIAIEEIRRCSGTQFDPRVVDAFISCHENGEVTLHRTQENAAD